MDESATGSANFWSEKARDSSDYDAAVKLRPPSFDHGVVSFAWAFGLGLYLWLGMLAIGVSGATAFIMAALAACAIFFFVRLFGEEELRRRPRGRA